MLTYLLKSLPTPIGEGAPVSVASVYLTVILSTLVACTSEDKSPDLEAATGSEKLSKPVFTQLSVQTIENSTPQGSSLAHVTSNDQEVVLSWVHKTADGHALAYSHSDNHPIKFKSVKTIAEGSDWFVNWADFPVVFLGSTGHMAAHWLERTTPQGYGYDIAFATSLDGNKWSSPERLHSDGTHTEHGFLSWYEHDQQIGAIWLDGRNTTPADDPHAHHATGAMTLRSVLLGNASIELDKKVCDCCQTSAVATDRGPAFFYRDRSDDEIRDIRVNYSQQTALVSDADVSSAVHNDNWRIDGCPVNGPQADAIANNVVIAWFTMNDGQAVVKAAHSNDSGRHFNQPVVLSSSGALGRVETVMMSSTRILVGYLEQLPQSDLAAWRITLLDEHLRVLSSEQLAVVANGRSSGFLRMTAINTPITSTSTRSSTRGGVALAAWTEGMYSSSQVHTALITVH